MDIKHINQYKTLLKQLITKLDKEKGLETCDLL